MAFDLLARVFDAQNIYKEAKVYKGNTVITDIDVLGIAGNKAIIVQAKSKRLTELGRKGNEQQLEIDFKKAIQEAYEQGILCRRAILDKDVTLFLDDKSKINLDESIDDVYIICLTSDHYPALKFQVNNYLKKKPGRSCSSHVESF